MHPSLPLLAAAALLLATSCATRSPTTATKLEPAIKAKVDKGLIEPGFTPEMVFLALGKPTEPTESLADATSSGTWVYRDFHQNGNGRELVKAGFRRRVVFDSKKKSDVVVNEPIEPQTLPTLPAHSLHVIFRDGRVVEIQRGADS
jgi:hypothetical protein